MGTRILKFCIESGSIEMDLPVFRDLLIVEMQNGKIHVWYRASLDSNPELVKFRVFGTGAEVPDDYYHHGTVFDGPLVWHLFGSSDSLSLYRKEYREELHAKMEAAENQ